MNLFYCPLSTFLAYIVIVITVIAAIITAIASNGKKD